MKTLSRSSLVFVFFLVALSSPAEPLTPAVTLTDFKLTGDLSEGRAAFTLTATAHVESPKGASLDLLSGTLALTDLGPHKQWHVRTEPNRYSLVFEHRGTFPIQIKFVSVVHQSDGWNNLVFQITPGVLQALLLHGLPAETQFDFPGGARPERKGTDFLSYLPADGAVKLSWKETRPEAEGKLFYSAEMLSQISVSPGLMRQAAVLDFKIMQGELNRVTFALHGDGEVTRVQGAQVLAWNVEPAGNDRRLVVQFNQAQKDQFTLLVQMQTPLGAFPLTATALQLQPEAASRFAGYFRIINDGAVRLEVLQATGLSQVSPDQFPENDATRAALHPTGSQCFAYRFSSPAFGLRIQADQILPELAVSQVLAYNLGENELSLEGELELEIREAPLRELVLRVPKGYLLARLSASGLNDYFLRESDDQPDAELRLVYGQPLSGRQVVQLRLERNQALGETNWILPRLEVTKAKSTRGHIAVSADPGFRLTPGRTQGLTEVPTAFFPKKIAGIQSAFRLSDSAWQASFRVERLPQTLQADGLHIFSIAEGIAYGSSLLNYQISGAPVSTFRIELSAEYLNVEFTGKDIRNWQKTDGGYLVQLHTPVAGPYSLLATYERPFKPQDETLSFAGARPLDAQSEQGHTVVISAYQFQVKPAEVSPGLLPLEPGEVPAEYRLFFDSPILAAYRYSSRPFNLKLSLSPLAQGESLAQVVDRASIVNRVSKEGQVLTDVRYFVKNRGNTHFRLTLPPGTELWSAAVNGSPVVPVLENRSHLIPLPPHADPNAILILDLKLAARARDRQDLTIEAPVVGAPVMLAEWRLEPDTGQRLVYRDGSLAPVGGVADLSGFAEIARVFSNGDASRAVTSLIVGFGLILAALVMWHAAIREGTYRFSPRHLVGALLGLIALVVATVALINFGGLISEQRATLPRNIALLVPVQQAETGLKVHLANLPGGLSVFSLLGYAWPAVLSLVFWAYGAVRESPAWRGAGKVAGWTLLAWAALRCPNGGVAFLILLACCLFFEVLLPAGRRWWQLPPRPASAPEPEPGTGAAPALPLLLLAGLFGLGAGQGFSARAHPPSADDRQASGVSERYASGALTGAQSSVPESVLQEIRIEDKFAIATARVHWQAEKGDSLPVLFDPAVLTGLLYPSNSLRLAAAPAGSKVAERLLALKNGAFDLEIHYELPVAGKDSDRSLTLPVVYGVVNQLQLTVVNLDVDVFSSQAVSVRRELVASNTVASLVLAPMHSPTVGWKPRSRDLRHEKPVFYAELSQLYIPSAGVIEGLHAVSIRPAQGELSELVLDVPAAATITDVSDGAAFADARSAKPGAASVVSLWRFDPDARKLRVTLSPPQSRPFLLLVRSQVATGPLPFDQSVGLLGVSGASTQIGLVGFATGSEVQLDKVSAAALSPINLEDFPAELPALLKSQIHGLTLHRAFRYSGDSATAALKASPVEPDIQVGNQTTLSLGEDRTILAADVSVTITRAGIFRLSFPMPAGFDVEAISGAALSHWTESRTDAVRVITLHLTGKTEGQQKFSISLAGSGVKAIKGWSVPQLVFREANKQKGSLLVVPEQGLRLQVASRQGVTQLDPQKAGIKQKGVLAFNLLQVPWSLSLDLEQVEPWIQVTSLQHASVNEAQIKLTANLQYQIENTGLRAFHVLVPTNAEGVHFHGDQLADFLPVAGAVTNGLQEWEIKLHRRVIGPYLLQASFQTLIPDRAPQALLRGLQAAGVNVQRGFVTVESTGRLHLGVEATPAALQPAEWQSIPRALAQGIPAGAANFTYRLVEDGFALPLKLQRREAAQLLPAHINNITFDSLVSDDGVMLSQVRLEMVPGDKRLLGLTLPPGAGFWFAFVNQNSVWPWREQDRILIPLEQQSRGNQPLTVEFFYACRVNPAASHSLALDLFAPKFDLPLENVSWQLSLNDRWQLKKWSGSLQLQETQTSPQPASLDLQGYLQNEAVRQRERTKEAEDFLAAGNSALQQGDPQQARRSFQTAYSLSTQDAAFNEDARVQLHNIKLQQAFIGLNVRQAALAGETDNLGRRFRDLPSGKDVVYTQQDAQDLIDRNAADENAAFRTLAERLIQQQDAAVTSPSAIHANLPEQGRKLTFKRAVVVDAWADLNLHLAATATRTASGSVRLLLLAVTVGLLLLCGLGRRAFLPAARS